MTILQPQYVYPLPGTQPVMHGGPEETYYKETASQTYAVGDLIYLDANGTIAKCTVSSLQLNSAILGQPDLAASGVTGAQVKFHAILPSEVYIMQAWNGTPASATFAQTDLGATFNIIKPTAAPGTGFWMVDKINAVVTTLPRVKVIGFPTAGIDTNGNWVTNVAIGDVYQPAYVMFLPFYQVANAITVALQLG